MSARNFRRLLVIALGTLAVLVPATLAQAACPTRPLPPCDRVIFTGAVGPHQPACVPKPQTCPFRTVVTQHGMRGPTGATGVPGRSGARGVPGPPGVAGEVGPAGTNGLQGVQGVMGALGLRGPVGADSAVPGPVGATGSTGAAGATGATGADSTVPGPSGAVGSAGPAGPAGPTGPAGADSTVAGPTGASGATGPAGPAGGLAQYAYVYNAAAEVVPLEAGVTFDSNGVMTPGITHAPGAAGITVLNAGAYKVTFSVSATEPSQISLFDNGVVIPGTTYGSGAGTQQNTGQAILMLAAGDVLTVVNHSSAAAIGLAALIGGTQTTANASVTIEQLA